MGNFLFGYHIYGFLSSQIKTDDKFCLQKLFFSYLWYILYSGVVVNFWLGECIPSLSLLLGPVSGS